MGISDGWWWFKLRLGEGNNLVDPFINHKLVETPNEETKHYILVSTLIFTIFTNYTKISFLSFDTTSIIIVTINSLTQKDPIVQGKRDMT